MFHLLSAAEFVEIPKTVFPFGIDRFEMNFTIAARHDLAAGQDIECEIYSHCARMKQVQRPKIEGAASQINPAGGVCHDGCRAACWLGRPRLRHQLSEKNCAMLRNFR